MTLREESDMTILNGSVLNSTIFVNANLNIVLKSQ